jgi:hypothetical protein
MIVHSGQMNHALHTRMKTNYEQRIGHHCFAERTEIEFLQELVEEIRDKEKDKIAKKIMTSNGDKLLMKQERRIWIEEARGRARAWAKQERDKKQKK